MKNLMNKFIDDQFTRLSTILLDQLNVDTLPKNLENYCFQIVGSGSSLNAAFAVSDYFPKETTIQTPEIFLEHMDSAEDVNYKNTILIAISQTASSIATMTVLKKMKSSGAYTLLITANEDFENSTVADVTIDLMAGEELIGPKSLGYTATVVRLIQLAEVIKKDFGYKNCTDLQEQISRGINQLPNVKNMALNWIKKNSDWAKLNFYTIASSESYVTAVRECTLKLLEVIRIPTVSYELGEFTHGPHRLFSSVGGNVFVVNEKDFDFANNIAQFGQNEGAKTLIIQFKKDVVNQTDNLLLLPETGVGNILELAILFQTIANELAARKNINADDRVFPTFFTAVGTKVDFSKSKEK